MKYIRILTALTALATSAFAQLDDKAFLTQFEKTFEPGGVIETSRFIPAELMTGPLHNVGARAYNDGLNNTYFLYSGGTEAEVTTGLALRTRIREIYAIDSLRRMSKSEEFGKAMAAAGKQKIEGVVGIVKDPLGTVAGIPKGASRFFGRIGEGLKGGKSEGEDGALASIAGVSKAKAQLAAKLGVSPYSHNADLQRELDATARAMAGGGLVVSAATAAVGGATGEVVSVLGMNETLQQTLVNNTPSDLRIINRKKLFALGVTRELADEFLMHPWYSPWHTTLTTDALSSIGVNPSAFLTDACRAITPEDALYFQRIAQVLARYHAAKAPLRSIRFERGVVCAIDFAGTLVVPLSCDYAIWAERAARRSEEFTVFAKAGGEIKGLALWVDGKISDRLAQELTTRQVSVQADALGGR